MGKSIMIGHKNFKSLKEAKSFYSTILNSYEFQESLNDEDFNLVMDLFEYFIQDPNIPIEETPEQVDIQANLFEYQNYIKDIKVINTGYKNKTFQFIPELSQPFTISYTELINKKYPSNQQNFARACKSSIQKDLIKVKQKYFKEFAISSMAPCQESKVYYKYEDLVLDHRQPNTLSIIIERFIEINGIDLELIKYKNNERNMIAFADPILEQQFIQYHKEKALLRIVHKSLNSSRSSMARVKQQKKDLRIE